MRVVLADLVVSVTTLLRRLRELDTGTSPFGERGVAAMQLLGERGFTAETLSEGEGLVEQVAEFSNAPRATLDAEEEARTVAALWAWYLEWSGIARAVIKNRSTLRRLGFRKSRRSAEAQPSGDDSGEFDDSDDVEDDDSGVETPEPVQGSGDGAVVNA